MTREGFQKQVPVLDVVAVARAWPPLIFLLKARRPEKYRDSIAVKTGDHDGGSESGIAPLERDRKQWGVQGLSNPLKARPSCPSVFAVGKAGVAERTSKPRARLSDRWAEPRASGGEGEGSAHRGLMR